MTLNITEVPEVLKTLFPEGVIADIWQDYTSEEWVVGNYEDDEVLLDFGFTKPEEAENVLLQNNIAYRIHIY